MFKLLETNAIQNGQRRFVASLCEVYPEECVVNGVGTRFNKNGITWLEKYCVDQLDTIAGASITAEFLNTEKTELFGHGDTGFAEDGFPKFENAESIGHFERAYIDDVVIDGETHRCVVGEGVIDEFRYKNLVDELMRQLAAGFTPRGSVEIFAKGENQSIIYENGYREQGRIPKEFIFSGYALLGITPADDSAVLLELNSEEFKMDEAKLQEMLDASVKTVLDKNAELESKISEVNAAKETAEQELQSAKDAKEELDNQITELNSKLDEKDQEIENLKNQIAEKDVELNQLHKNEKIAELNKMLSKYTVDSQKVATAEINAFKEDPLNADMDAIENKICRHIVSEMNKKKSETNGLLGGDDFVNDDLEDDAIFA